MRLRVWMKMGIKKSLPSGARPTILGAAFRLEHKM
jgi:hypothetical protein